MLDIGWSELLLLGVLALLLLGPRELPPLMRMMGQFAATLRENLWRMRDALEGADVEDNPIGASARKKRKKKSD